MRFYVGTSAYSVKEWKGSFYPAKLPAKEMLSYYSQRLPAVEINNSFYKMPTSNTVESWAEQVPESFRFAVKAPQSITHFKRLNNIEEPTDLLIDTTAVLKERRGPLFFQLPPNFKKDIPRLDTFLKYIGTRAPATFEFRHESWQCEEVYECLHAHGCALCAADTDELPITDLVSTAQWGYVRLRKADYTDAQLAEWVKKIKAQPWDEVYVFFKHEETGTGPRFAAKFLELA